MTRQKLLVGWLIGGLFFSALGLRHPTFGAIVATSLIVMAGLLNSLLEINSATIGRFLGLLVGAVTLASCVGAHLGRLETVFASLTATLAGFLFVAFPVSRTTSDNEQSKFKSGGGGDFGGGGASGKF